jgi:hypothetical protein
MLLIIRLINIPLTSRDAIILLVIVNQLVKGVLLIVAHLTSYRTSIVLRDAPIG